MFFGTLDELKRDGIKDARLHALLDQLEDTGLDKVFFRKRIEVQRIGASERGPLHVIKIDSRILLVKAYQTPDEPDAAQKASDLGVSPTIIKRGRSSMAEEFLQGEPLTAPPDEYGRELGLLYRVLHSNGVAYGSDIKQDHVLSTERGVKLIDFGCSRMTNDQRELEEDTQTAIEFLKKLFGMHGDLAASSFMDAYASE